MYTITAQEGIPRAISHLYLSRRLHPETSATSAQQSAPAQGRLKITGNHEFESMEFPNVFNPTSFRPSFIHPSSTVTSHELGVRQYFNHHRSFKSVGSLQCRLELGRTLHREAVTAAQPREFRKRGINQIGCAMQ